MADMMGDPEMAAEHGDMAGMDHGAMPGMDHGAMPGMDHGAMPGMDHGCDAKRVRHATRSTHRAVG